MKKKQAKKQKKPRVNKKQAKKPKVNKKQAKKFIVKKIVKKPIKGIAKKPIKKVKEKLVKKIGEKQEVVLPEQVIVIQEDFSELRNNPFLKKIVRKYDFSKKEAALFQMGCFKAFGIPIDKLKEKQFEFVLDEINNIEEHLFRKDFDKNIFDRLAVLERHSTSLSTTDKEKANSKIAMAFWSAIMLAPEGFSLAKQVWQRKGK